MTAELTAIEGQEEEINDRFYRELTFGTGGLRGVIGAGTNRMNIYTVRKATQGFADYLNAHYRTAAVAISFDSRIKSDVFAKEAARVLAANGILVHLYPQLMPTPCLSFAVRDLRCQGGIMITASHNPSKYNGYKAYGEDGCQMTEEAADEVLAAIGKIDLFTGVKTLPFDEAVQAGRIRYISDMVVARYMTYVKNQTLFPDVCEKQNFRVVYTPLNGTGNKPVRSILNMIGIEDVIVVKSQELPDGNFPTCPYPNPEIREALTEGLKLCETAHPDLLLATDPDCDRVGIAVPDEDYNYQLLTGNEVGALLFEYICRERVRRGTMPRHPVAVKTIVTTDIIRRIAEDYGVELRNVLTGFKYIGEQIGLLEDDNEERRYIFGFEESYGYLAGSYVRDKDAVVASMLICEMAASYKLRGETLLQALGRLYRKYGVYLHRQQSFVCEGEKGMEEMSRMMDSLRNAPPASVAGLKTLEVSDYLNSYSEVLATGEQKKIDLPSSNVIGLSLEDNAGVIIRPSGTEPKIKVYYTANCPDMEEATARIEAMQADFARILGF